MSNRFLNLRGTGNFFTSSPGHRAIARSMTAIARVAIYPMYIHRHKRTTKTFSNIKHPPLVCTCPFSSEDDRHDRLIYPERGGNRHRRKNDNGNDFRRGVIPHGDLTTTRSQESPHKKQTSKDDPKARNLSHLSPPFSIISHEV